MSEGVLNPDTVIGGMDDKPSFLKWKPMFQLLGLVFGLGYWAFLAFGNQTGALNSFMYGYIFWLAGTLGCLALTLLHGSINSSWTLSVLRIFEAGSSPQMFGALAFFFIPIRMHMGEVYPWADPHHIDDVLKYKAPYLNQNGFDIRFVVFIIAMAALSYFMRRSSRRQDKSLDDKERQFRSNLGSFGLVALAMIITFFLTDVAMSLTPHWYSTIYPLWLVIGGAQTALTLGIILVCSNAKKKPYSDSMSPALTRDLGNMMFVLTMLWGYTSVSQLIILWNGNLPETAVFYAVRGADAKLGWNYIGFSTIIGCFFIPFCTLLSTRYKRYADRILKIACLIFVFRLLDVYWIIAASVPHRDHASAVPVWSDIAGVVVMGFVWMAVTLTMVAKDPLLPLYDNRLKEAKANAH